MRDASTIVAGYQTELFQHIGEFYGRAIGMRPHEFASIAEFDNKIKGDGHRIAHRVEEAFTWADRELRDFYSKKGIEIFRLASQLGGLKLVLGGSSRFHGAHLASVRAALLYADTVLIPDPVFPWFEVERSEEKFRHILTLKAAHTLLHLRPIVDADLAHCPVLVFPSWEKSFENHDVQTRSSTLQMLVDVFGHFVDPTIATSEDIAKVVRDRPEQVLRAIEQHRLFIAPGGFVGEPVMNALTRYEEDVQRWRSSEWQEQFRLLSPAEKVTSGLLERLQPQYHLLENADELNGHPLLPIEQQAHYFELISQVNSERLARIGLLDKQTKGMLAGMRSQRMGFLSDISIDTLVEIRKSNDNEGFRKRMKTAVANLHESTVEDIDRVAAEMCREIQSGIADHNRLLHDIEEKFRIKKAQNIGAGVLTGMALLWPSLAPFVGVGLPIAVVTKFGWDAWEKYAEKKKHSRSLMGFLATAKLEES